MTSIASSAFHSALLLAGAAAALAAAPAPAQPQAGQSEPTITVTAPRHTVVQRGISSPIQTVSLSAHVSYRDLNLKTAAGRTTLQGRVSSAAGDVCKKLEAMYPGGSPDARTCAREAQKSAKPQVDAAIAKAI